MIEKAKNQDKLYSVDFIRFIFSAVIVYYHIFHTNIKSVAEGLPMYEKLFADCAFGGAAVECFFIISGYFLYKSFRKRPDISVTEFAYNKFARLWPVVAVYCLISIVLFGFDGYDALYHLLFLQAAGFKTKVTGILWYISPLFIVMVFMFAFYKNTKDKKKYNLFLAAAVYFSYVMVINDCGKVFGRDNIYGIFSLSVLRAVAGIGLGYLVAVLQKQIESLDFVKKFKGTRVTNTLIFAAVSVVEITSFYYLMRYFLDSRNSYDQQFISVILFTAFFACLLTKRGIFTLIFNNKFFGFFGKYAYSIYVMQQISFNILKRTLWQNADYVSSHFLRTVLISTAFAVVLGTVTYYAVEKPCSILLSKFGRKLFAKSGRE